MREHINTKIKYKNNKNKISIEFLIINLLYNNFLSKILII